MKTKTIKLLFVISVIVSIASTIALEKFETEKILFSTVPTFIGILLGFSLAGVVLLGTSFLETKNYNFFKLTI
jgi:hypothetical protein